MNEDEPTYKLSKIANCDLLSIGIFARIDDGPVGGAAVDVLRVREHVRVRLQNRRFRLFGHAENKINFS